VAIAVLDSGIKWNDAGAMEDLRGKARLWRPELPKPRTDRRESLERGVECRDLRAGRWDANRDGVFNVLDYSCDGRVERNPEQRARRDQPRGAGPLELLDPQDVLIAFTDGADDDGNGYVDDIVGWDFMDDDNDPYDDVQYGHGTGEARDSTAEAANGGALGTCPNCMFVPLRVGDSFIAEEGRFAVATAYAVDNDVMVVQEALGTLNHTRLARQAIDYAYAHGVTVVASAADEAAQHHNWPSSNDHVVLVNSVTKYDELFTRVPPSYLQFNGCTNFYSKLTLSIPSVSCSSDAVGRASGMAGLIYSAARNAGEEKGKGRLRPNPDCRHADRSRCLISANEVRQVMASGTVDGIAQADDVNFAHVELSCEPEPLPPCTDPNLNSVNATRLVAPFPLTLRYPARRGHDQFYGYGRVNLNRAVDAVDPPGRIAPRIPPEVEITGPPWYTQVDPGRRKLPVRGEVFARGRAYTCRVLVAPGSQPNNAEAPKGDFEQVGDGPCDGGARRGRLDGVLARIDVPELRRRFPQANVGDFSGREPGAGGLGQTSNGRPNSEPYGFTVKVVAASSSHGSALTGEDRRNLYLHRDADLLKGWPRQLPSDGASSPLLVDLDADNRNELVVATSDGFVHAFRPDGSEARGWPVRSRRPALHRNAPAFTSGALSDDVGAPFLASVASGDLDRDGSPEVVGADFDGRVYAWDARGKLVLERRTLDRYSGRPQRAFVDVREGVQNRTQRGFLGAPVLADLDRDDGGKLEIVAAAMDRHLYAWNDDGKPVEGFPLLVVDPSKVARVDDKTHQVTFNAAAGDPLNQGAIVNTPAVGDISGGGRPEIVVGTNEEYEAGAPGEGGPNIGLLNTTVLGALNETGVIDQLGIVNLANTRAYAISARGDRDGRPGGGRSPYLDGWPAKLAVLSAELLPVVGEGVTGSPVIAPIRCGSEVKPAVGVMPAAGLGYLLGPDGDSCLGKDPVNGSDLALGSDVPGNVVTDLPVFPAAGHPAFGEFAGGVSFLAPAAGLRRALDLAVNEYQQGSQDFLGAWNPRNGQFRLGFPHVVNDLQFLSGPTIADIDGKPGEEALAGTSSLDLVAVTGSGQPVSKAWPKLTADWTVADPLSGSFGVKETAPGARKTVISLTRSGSVFAYGTSAPACSPASWPRFHHDNANSGDLRRDAVAPGRPAGLSAREGRISLTAPGDDLLCGAADRYEVVRAKRPVDGARFNRLRPVTAGAEPEAAGTRQAFDLPPGRGDTATVRAVDEQGNVGPVTAVPIR
jgi:hypothetical protein